MNSEDTLISHVQLLEKIIQDLKVIEETEDNDAKFVYNIHKVSDFCNQTIDVYHQLIGRLLLKQEKSER